MHFASKEEAQQYLDIIRERVKALLIRGWSVDLIREHTGITKNRLKELLNELQPKYNDNKEIWREIAKVYIAYKVPRNFFWINLTGG